MNKCSLNENSSNLNRMEEETNTIYSYNEDSDIRIKQEYETLAGFKTWLSTHPTEVQYELAEPIITTLS